MKKNILITGVGGRSFGSGILYSLKCLDKKIEDRWRIIATDCDPFSWGLYVADHKELLPPATSRDYIKNLIILINKYKVDAIVPGTQVEGDVIVNNSDKLSGIAIIANRKELYPLMMDKYNIVKVLEHEKINFIETFPFKNWKKVVEKYGFPFIVKPTKDTGGSRGLFIVCSKEEVKIIEPLMDFSVSPCVQPYVGDEDNEYTVGVLTDKNGDMIDSIVIKRKLIGLSLLINKKYKGASYSVSTGYSQGYIVKHKMIQNFCENLALRLKSTGPLNIQLRIHQGKIYVFEIHPRFSGTTPIRASVGFNEVDILLRNYIFNEKFKRVNYKYNVAAIRNFNHVIVPINKMVKH